MSPKLALNDILVVIPGITGSILQKNGLTIWGPVHQSIIGYVESLFASSGGWSFDDLRVLNDDPEVDDLGDGVKATGLVPYTLIPGLDRFDGYTGLVKQIHAHFAVTCGDATRDNGPPANYYEFPYDWRRDNRASARLLKKLVQRELPKWRKFRNYPDAKVILIAHSMGGLVARYYVECMGGFEYTRAIITFGTPHRGSVQTLEYLINGYRKLGLRLSGFTEVMRSLRSVYQTLPIYECLSQQDQGGSLIWRRVAETSLPHIEGKGARDALCFHREIERCHGTNCHLDEYDVAVLPVIGWGHKTLQSAMHFNNMVVCSDRMPPAVEEVLSDGDGTVARISAIPLELHNKPNQWWQWNQKHSSMQNNEVLLANIAQALSVLQGQLGQPARGLGRELERNHIDLQVEDVYLADEPVKITVTTTAEPEPTAVLVDIKSRERGEETTVRSMKRQGDAWTCEERLPAGAYGVTAQLKGVPAASVTDIFEVA